MGLSEKQQKVFDLATEKLKKQYWFRGVCMDNFPSDRDIDRDGLEESAASVFWETAHWDAPTIC